MTYKTPKILSKLSSKTGTLEKPFDISSSTISFFVLFDSNAKTSTLGHIICLVSTFPKFTMPFNIFFSSLLVSFESVNSNALDNLSTESCSLSLERFDSK